jgi:hypothetical protein
LGVVVVLLGQKRLRGPNGWCTYVCEESFIIIGTAPAEDMWTKLAIGSSLILPRGDTVTSVL